MLRLDAIPSTHRVQSGDASGMALPALTSITCVLCCGPLPAHQRLEVQINGRKLSCLPDGNQLIFSWQFLKASDEAKISLWSGATEIQYWQGCWNERDAILHAGTLPVQIVFDGKVQPAAEDEAILSAVVLPAEVMQVNGVCTGQGHVLSNGGAVSPSASAPPPTQALLAESPDGQSSQEEQPVPRARDRAYSDMDDDEPSEGAGGDELDEENLEQEGEWEQEREEDEEVVEQEGASADEETGTQRTTPQYAPAQDQAPFSPIPRVVPFHASPLPQGQALQALKELVATMPLRTLIVDLREQDRKPRRYQTQSALSKETLRAVFGAKYWDRSWAIRTSVRMRSSTQRGVMPQWEAVVSTPDHPDGVPALEQAYQEGCSLIVMDSRARYEESARRAVIDLLRQHIPDLHIGSGT